MGYLIQIGEYKNKKEEIREIIDIEEDLRGAISGLFGNQRLRFYAPIFDIPSPPPDIYDIFFPVHNTNDQRGVVWTVVHNVTTGEVSVGKTDINAFDTIFIRVEGKGIKNSHVLDLIVGWETTPPGRVHITHKQRIVIQIGGRYLDESAARLEEINWYGTFSSAKIYPVIGSLTIRLRYTPPILMMPVLRYNGKNIEESRTFCYMLNIAYARKGLYGRVAAATDEKLSEWMDTLKDIELGFDKRRGTILAASIITQPGHEIKHFMAYHAIGSKVGWWKFWEWKADDNMLFAVGTPPSYVEMSVKFGVVRKEIPTENELHKVLEVFHNECIQRGIIGMHVNNLIYTPRGWGGICEIKATAAAYSLSLVFSIVPLITAIMPHIIVIAALVIGILVIFHFVIRPLKFPYVCPFCGMVFKTQYELTKHIDLMHGEKIKEAGIIPQKCPVTREPIPEHIDTMTEYYKWLCARHPNICRDLGIFLPDKEEVEIEEDVIRRIAIYTIATAAVYAGGSLAPEKYRLIKIAAIIPGVLAAYEGYRLIKIWI